METYLPKVFTKLQTWVYIPTHFGVNHITYNYVYITNFSAARIFAGKQAIGPIRHDYCYVPLRLKEMSLALASLTGQRNAGESIRTASVDRTQTLIPQDRAPIRHSRLCVFLAQDSAHQQIRDLDRPAIGPARFWSEP